MLSIIGLRVPVSHKVWTKYTTQLTENAQKVAERNVKLAAEEIRQKASGSGKLSNYCASVGVSFDCSWNSRGWQAKQGVVVAIAQDNGKIIDVVHKVSYCRECKTKQSDRDNKRISAMDYLNWFLKHEIDCSLNHSGSPQVKNLFL